MTPICTRFSIACVIVAPTCDLAAGLGAASDPRNSTIGPTASRLAIRPLIDATNQEIPGASDTMRPVGGNRTTADQLGESVT